MQYIENEKEIWLADTSQSDIYKYSNKNYNHNHNIMNITTSTLGAGIKVVIDGRIDTTNYNEFEQLAEKLFGEGVKTIYLDCSKLSYISSSGLRIFLSIQKKMMAAGGKFLLYGMQAGIKEIFDISGFSSVFSIFDSEEQACKEWFNIAFLSMQR